MSDGDMWACLLDSGIGSFGFQELLLGCSGGPLRGVRGEELYWSHEWCYCYFGFQWSQVRRECVDLQGEGQMWQPNGSKRSQTEW